MRAPKKSATGKGAGRRKEIDGMKRILRALGLATMLGACLLTLLVWLDNRYLLDSEESFALCAAQLLLWLGALLRARLRRRAPSRLRAALSFVADLALWVAAFVWILSPDLPDLLLSGGLFAAGRLCALRFARRAVKKPVAESSGEEIAAAIAPVSAPAPRPHPVRSRVVLACAAPLLLLMLAALRWTNANRLEPIPESLQVFKQKYPEASEFVDNYPLAHGLPRSTDVSGDLEEGVVPLFLQWDARWGYRDYGGGFFATNGCGPTCLSMVVCGLTGEAISPYDVARYSESQGWYVPGSGTSWDLMTEGAAHYGLCAEKGRVSGEYIASQLDAGRVLIASMKPGDFTYTGHFIVLTGQTADGLVAVNDSNSPENSEKAWEMETLTRQMKSVWSYWAEAS